MARKNSNRRRKRRGRFGFLYKLLSVCLICAAMIVALTLFFKVNTITVSGQVRYTEQEIRKAAGVDTGDNLFLLNKYRIANKLLSGLPYIEEVRINRKLPDTLLIDVTECTSVYAVSQGSTVYLISAHGKIVDSTTDAQAMDLPQIDGCELQAPSVGGELTLPAERQNQQASLLALLSALEETKMTDQVTAIHLDSLSELTMDCADRFTVKLLYSTDYGYKLRNLQAVIDALETNQTGIIDLTKDGEAHFLPK